MKHPRNEGLALTTLSSLNVYLNSIDEIDGFKVEERGELERLLKTLLEDPPVVEMLDQELAAMRAEMPRQDFGDRLPDVAVARDARRILRRALGLPDESNNEPKERYD